MAGMKDHTPTHCEVRSLMHFALYLGVSLLATPQSCGKAMSSLFCERAELAIMVVYVLLQAHKWVGTGTAGDAEVLGPGEGNRHIFFGSLLICLYQDIVVQRLLLSKGRGFI